MLFIDTSAFAPLFQKRAAKLEEVLKTETISSLQGLSPFIFDRAEDFIKKLVVSYKCLI